MSAEKETLGRVQNGLFHLQRGLTPFVSARMKVVHGGSLAPLREPRARLFAFVATRRLWPDQDDDRPLA